MSAEHIGRQLESLRAAGQWLRERPLEEILERLEVVLEGWRDPHSPWRDQLQRRLPQATGFAPETVRHGTDLALRDWTGKALREVVAAELGGLHPGDASPRVQPFSTTAVILAGSIPMPTLLAMLTPLLLRSPVLAKPASRDPVTPELVVRSVAQVDPWLGECLALAEVPERDARCTRALLEADCVVATGSDEALAGIHASLPEGHHWVAHGHRLSIAVLGEEATGSQHLQEVAPGLALDTALWDQLGCLSPIAVYVVGGGREACQRTAGALAAALEDAEARWPSGRIPLEVAAQRNHEIEVARMRAASGSEVSLHLGSAQRWALVCENDARPRNAPLHRFLRVHPVEDLTALEDTLQPLAPHLAGVAMAGFGSASADTERRLRALGASHVCAPGQLQTPPLGWRRDGRPLLLTMARFEGSETVSHAGRETAT